MSQCVDVASAQAVMGRLLAGSERRRAHVAGVAATAARVSRVLGLDDVVVTAAWLHDIGYAPELVDTGLHGLDGARYLRAAGYDERVCRLVANHTHAWVEAGERGLAEVLSFEFPAEHSLTADVLTYADLTTGPTGEPVTVKERLREILWRYPATHVVSRSIASAATDLVAATARVEQAISTGDTVQRPR